MLIATKKTVGSSKTATGGSKTTAKGSTNGVGGKAATGGGGGGKQKRSPWDLKGRLQDMEVMMADERKYSSNTIGDLQTQVLYRLKFLRLKIVTDLSYGVKLLIFHYSVL